MSLKKRTFLAYLVFGSFILVIVTISFIKKFPYDYYYLLNLLRRTLEGKDVLVGTFWKYFLIIFPFFISEFYLEKKLQTQTSTERLGVKYPLRLGVMYFFATLIYFFLVPEVLGQGDTYLMLPLLPVIALIVAILASILGGIRILLLKYSFNRLPTDLITLPGVLVKLRKVILFLNLTVILILLGIFYYDYSTQGIHLHLSDWDNTIQIAKKAVTSKDVSKCQNADKKDICVATYIMGEYKRSALDIEKLNTSQLEDLKLKICKSISLENSSYCHSVVAEIVENETLSYLGNNLKQLNIEAFLHKPQYYLDSVCCDQSRITNPVHLVEQKAVMHYSSIFGVSVDHWVYGQDEAKEEIFEFKPYYNNYLLINEGSAAELESNNIKIIKVGQYANRINLTVPLDVVYKMGVDNFTHLLSSTISSAHL